MTVEEIFKELSEHMIKGFMIHEKLANYYDFLSLKGYKRLHEYYYLEESCMYRKLCRYYINHYDKLIPESSFDDPEVIPVNWYRYSRHDVDVSSKRNAVKTGIAKWVDWEKETKKLYQNMYKELMDLGEVAAAQFIGEYVCAVDYELKKAERCQLNRVSTDYDIVSITQDQHDLHDKYKHKVKEVGEMLC